jgi:hypothetical protein
MGLIVGLEIFGVEMSKNIIIVLLLIHRSRHGSKSGLDIGLSIISEIDDNSAILMIKDVTESSNATTRCRICEGEIVAEVLEGHLFIHIVKREDELLDQAVDDALVLDLGGQLDADRESPMTMNL